MAIDYKHKDYTANIDRWVLADSVCRASNVEDYLIELNPDDTSSENKTRNENYKKRAVFYPIAGYTLQGYIGLLFSKYPEINLPPQLDYIVKNTDGAGVSIYQQSQQVAQDIIKKGRDGLLVTYPKTGPITSKADMNSGSINATIHKIDAEQIINWRTETVGSETRLSLVVIMEDAEEIQADGYEVKNVPQIRELSLSSGVYIVQLWRKNDKDEWILHDEPQMPTDARGKAWSEIPFVFLGAVSNTVNVDDGPMYSLSKINVAHYRNSADYEDSVWYCGQAQPWMSGITQTHLDLMNTNKMYIGSRSLFGVPSGETFGFASAQENPLVRQAMIDKVDMMIGLGARFIQEGGVAKTASESNNDAKVQHSSLTLVSSNVSEGYTKALQWVAKYMGVESEIEYQTNMDFISPTATAQDIQAMVAGFIQGAIPASDYFNWLKKVEIVDEEKTLEEFNEEINTVTMPDLDTNAE